MPECPVIYSVQLRFVIASSFFIIYRARFSVVFFVLTRVLLAFHNSNDKVNLKMWPCPPIVYICVWDERELLCIGQNR